MRRSGGTGSGRGRNRCFSSGGGTCRSIIRHSSAGGRIVRYPAHIVKVHLYPCVKIFLKYRVLIAFGSFRAVFTSRGKTGNISGGHSEVPENKAHGGCVHCAVSSLGVKQKVMQRRIGTRKIIGGERIAEIPRRKIILKVIGKADS